MALGAARKTVLVTGAAGFFGLHLVEGLGRTIEGFRSRPAARDGRTPEA
jgi:nucleoside-diphosphate-sugar epimerase